MLSYENKQNANASSLFLHRAYMPDGNGCRAVRPEDIKHLVDLLSGLNYNELFYNWENCLAPEDAAALEVYCAERSVKLMPVPDRLPENYSCAICSTDMSFAGMSDKTVSSIAAAIDQGKEDRADGFLLIDKGCPEAHPQFVIWRPMLCAAAMPIAFASQYAWGTEKKVTPSNCEKIAKAYVGKTLFGSEKVMELLYRMEYYYRIDELSRVHLGCFGVTVRDLEQLEFDVQAKREIIFNCQAAILSSNIAMIRSGVKLPDSKLEELASRIDWIVTELSALQKSLNAQEKQQLHGLKEEILALKGAEPDTMALMSYNKFSYRVSIAEAFSGTVFEILHRLGIKYYELAESDSIRFSQLSDAEIAIISNRARKYGLSASIIAPDSLDAYENALQAASMLSADYIKVSAFQCRGDEAEAENTVEKLQKMCAAAKKQGVRLLLANKAGSLADTAENCEKMLKALFHSGAHFLFDPEEFIRCGQDVKKAYALLKARIKVICTSASGEIPESLEYIFRSLCTCGYYANRNDLRYISLSPSFKKYTDAALLAYIGSGIGAPTGHYLPELNMLEASIERELRETARSGKPDLLESLLKRRQLPSFHPRKVMLEILFREVYGYLPAAPDRMEWKITKNCISAFCAGKATIDRVELTSYFDGKVFTFPIYVTIPVSAKKHPFIILPNFRDAVPDRYFPTEELVDNGFAVLSFGFENVTSDDDDFTDGLAGVIYEGADRGPTSPGKIAMWAWAVHRVMDYAYTLDSLDKSCAAVCGHSRLGKTALFAAATDERFQFAYSNDSGCSGAALSRGNKGESVQRICKYFPFFFCENYKKYIGNEEQMPFDQHYLTAAIAPRHVYIASASNDTWADPLSEILNCVAIGPVYQKYGKPGFICDNRLPESGNVYHEGSVGYHIREGLHYFSREDWNHFIRFVMIHK